MKKTGKKDFFRTKPIHDGGFDKWVQANDTAFKVIKWVSLLLSFKFYRMTYSLFMGSKQLQAFSGALPEEEVQEADSHLH